jgi:hypothetical protein
MKLLTLGFALIGAGQAIGQQQLNQLFLDEAVKVETVKEVTSFNALFIDMNRQPAKVRDLIHFDLWIDAKAMPTDSGTKYPLLDILSGGKLLATVPVKVSGPSRDGQVVLEWSLSPHIDEGSRITLQLYPGTEMARYVAIPISEAKGVFVDNDRERAKLTYTELQTRAKAAISNVR